jgi:CRP-like cAMP-binding protein
MFRELLAGIEGEQRDVSSRRPRRRLGESGVLIDLPLSRDDVAQMTGTTLYTVSRIISRFEATGSSRPADSEW